MWTIKGVTIFREGLGRPLEFRQKLQEKKRFILETHKHVTFFGAIGSALPDHVKTMKPEFHRVGTTTKSRLTDIRAAQSICETVGFARIPFPAPDGVVRDPDDYLYLWLKPTDTELVKDFYRDNVINDMDRGMPTGMPHDTAMSIQKNRNAEEEKREEMAARKKIEGPTIDDLLPRDDWDKVETPVVIADDPPVYLYTELIRPAQFLDLTAEGLNALVTRYKNVPGRATYVNIGYASAAYDPDSSKLMFFNLYDYCNPIGRGTQSLTTPYVTNVHKRLRDALIERAHLDLNNIHPGKVYRIQVRLFEVDYTMAKRALFDEDAEVRSKLVESARNKLTPAEFDALKHELTKK